MAELPAPILTLCILLPLAAALASAHRQARSFAIGALGIVLILLLDVSRRVLAGGGASIAEPWGLPFFADGLNAVLMVLFAGIALVTAIAAPRRDISRGFLAGLLTLTASTLAAYAAANLAVFLVAWIVPVVPFLRRRLPGIVLGASAVSLAIAVALIGSPGTPIGPALKDGIDGSWAPAFLVLAVILRERIFPFHRATFALFDGSPILLAALLANSNPGGILLIRLIPVDALSLLGAMALFTALYTAVLGIGERQPRRLLVTLIVSQSSAILAGLSVASHEGIAGALAQWLVLGVSSTMLVVVYRALEARLDAPFDGNGFMGLAASMPRLAVFFAISGLALVGLPGTLGFAGEDLLIHGVLARYSWWGAALPVAIALNAYHAFRLFARLFLGKDAVTRNTAADATPRERWALSACLAFLVGEDSLPAKWFPCRPPR